MFTIKNQGVKVEVLVIKVIVVIKEGKLREKLNKTSLRLRKQIQQKKLLKMLIAQIKKDVTAINNHFKELIQKIKIIIKTIKM